ncbi:amidoligase enzyme [Ornithobacterium rhinotracheale]|uniref:amidoligase family protein n=1 Tax=Ornithobacterium rhinotracheale TaxID=28251 RepID=UPI00129C8851|nr:amidoligase family protein [Ornithobacterium rhinotracheale]MRJ09738.1 amidoligase enzyme [Ornithobacterium rhinotracheale]
MTQQEILNQNWTKTKKAKALYDLGLTRTQVASLVCGGNYGFAYNIWKKWCQEGGTPSPTQTFESLNEFIFNRKFGVEIEFFGPSDEDLAFKMNLSGLAYQMERYNHATRNHWKFTTDSSIRGDNAKELVSPPLQGNDGLQALRKACKALRLADAKVNRSCGLHIHIDANDFDLESFKLLVRNWIRIEPQIDQMMPPSRRANNNTYCQSNIDANIDQRINRASTILHLTNIFGTRYKKLNLLSFQRHGTIEFRQHGGSTNYRKIKQWILICSRLVEASKQGISINNLNQILDNDLQEYYEDRQLSF